MSIELKLTLIVLTILAFAEVVILAIEMLKSITERKKLLKKLDEAGEMLKISDEIPVAASTTIYQGALVTKNTSGHAVAVADTAGLAVVGIAEEGKMKNERIVEVKNG